jgi:hypothetical protein
VSRTKSGTVIFSTVSPDFEKALHSCKRTRSSCLYLSERIPKASALDNDAETLKRLRYDRLLR